MKNLSKQVVFLENISSEFVQSAIIILKENSLVSNDKIIAEAERIVGRYFDKKSVINPIETPEKSKSIKLLKTSVVLLSLSLCISLYFAIFK